MISDMQQRSPSLGSENASVIHVHLGDLSLNLGVRKVKRTCSVMYQTFYSVGIFKRSTQL